MAESGDRPAPKIVVAVKPVAKSKTTAKKGASPRVTPYRLALCCQFAEAPIAFRTTTATSVLRLSPAERAQKLSRLCLGNADALLEALQYCVAEGIGGFRIASSILPVKTHPAAGYRIDSLSDAEAIVARFRRCGAFAAEHDVRTTFHPDQFVVLNSPRPEVVARSIEDLEYHAEVAEWVGADVINIHAGGAYGDKPTALDAWRRGFDRLSEGVRRRLTLENDDTTYTPADLLPLCRQTGVPLVYDVHHHRCLRDELSLDEATHAAATTWNREPLLHLSSPAEGWSGPRPERHHDFIDPADFPALWRTLTATIEIEAKAKEVAIRQLQADLAASGDAPSPRPAVTRRRR